MASNRRRIVYRILPQPSGYRSFGIFMPKDQNSYSVRRCPVCHFPSPSDRRFPAEVEFQGGREADFHSGGGVFMTSKGIANELSKAFSELEIHDINVHYPTRKGRFSTHLVEILPRKHVNDFRSDTLIQSVKRDCGHCHSRFFEFRKVDQVVTMSDAQGELDYRIVRYRPPDEGIVLRQSDVGEERIFQFGVGLLFCTEEVKDYVESRGWTNILFLAVGVIANDVYIAEAPGLPM